MSFTVDAEIKSFEGKILKLSHESVSNNCKMSVNIYLPPQYSSTTKTPVLLYLSGLGCSPNNVTEKGGWFSHALKYGFALVFPDTSPRNVAEDDERWWVGSDAGYYVDLTLEPWSKHYHMYSYISKELPDSLAKLYSGLDFNNISISGHSVGGFGALMFQLKLQKFKSCSVFSPMCDINNNTWTDLALSLYLGKDKSLWLQYDIVQLLKNYPAEYPGKILVHIGKADPFYDNLKPQTLLDQSKGTPLEGKIDLNIVDGYDHSYFFVSTFVGVHAEFHAKNLGLL